MPVHDRHRLTPGRSRNGCRDADFLSLWVFVVMGIAASVGGIMRGHLVFTDVMNRPHLASELARTKRVRLFTDVLMAALLTVDALLLASHVEAADGGAHDRARRRASCSPRC